MKQGYVGVTIIACVLLGAAGVGKSSVKCLLLDQRPPHLRTSTVCAETPIRIEIRRISESRFQNLGGQWKEVKDKEMVETIARMILLADRESSHLFSEPDTAADVAAERKGAGKSSKKSELSFLTKIVNWIKKRDKEKEGSSEKTGGGASAQASSATSDACQRAVKKIMDKLVECISKLRLESEEGRVVALSNPVEQLLESKWIYFSDCGGQPEYQELLPLFVQRISAALCVTRLTDKLDEIVKSEYFDEGEAVGVALPTQHSSKDTIKFLFNTVQSYSTQDQPTSILLIGTHLDKLEEKIKQLSLAAGTSELSSGAAGETCRESVACGGIETVEDKNKQLLEMLEPEFSKQLIPYRGDKKSLLFPVNSLNPGEREKAIAQSIRSAVESCGGREEKIPIWWYVMELLLQELSKELGRGVLGRAECLEMARLVDIGEGSLDAALVYFDELNIIKYNQKVLPEVVFVDSQIPLDKVSEIVYHSYLVRHPRAETAEPSSSKLRTLSSVKYFTEYGVVSNEFLEQFPRHYVPGIFTKEHLITLLTSQLVFAEIPPPEASPGDKRKYYMMPALTQPLPVGELEKHRVFSPLAAPLLVRFPGGSRRSGVFCCFVAHLIRYYGWKLLLDSKKRLYRNCAKLQLLTSPPSTVTIIDSNTYIEVHVRITAPASSDEVTSSLVLVRLATLNGIQAACVALNYKMTNLELTFFCPHTPPPTSSAHQPQQIERHTATITDDKRYWRCDPTPELTGTLDEQHLNWFGISPGTFITPTSTSC